MELKELSKKFGVGITGGIASGKSSASQILASWGFLCIDADKLARDAVLPGTQGLEAIKKIFANYNILMTDGSLDRKKLGEIIFKNLDLRKRLEAIVHPEIQNLLRQHLEKANYFQNPKLWFYEAALLFEANLANRFKEVWLVCSKPSTQLARLKQRDPMISSEKAEAIMAAQMPNEEKRKLAKVVIENDGDIKQLSTKIQQALDTLQV